MINFQKIEIKDKNDFKKVPNPFIGLITKQHLGKTCISFKTDRDDVTLSRELKKILNKINFEKSNLLFLTNNLTLEGEEILKKNSIEYINISNFPWTDESYISIRK
ncbi:hypothetical protein E0I26_10435 [Flavobacterium rhamnosiphilum]|uniref:Uncharacterized protein n=1 Tax=Flavobacterium rhamnosiphilum TaxID=2541724 RepID=A0A4R5F6H5_9FLAO|nr:hypothetical protein [Flavobacterium rhamnosiphilum]TDE43464.1 hypothetical protein E0I26_10435 [Flavobacterium rhamnosiphilum]